MWGTNSDRKASSNVINEKQVWCPTLSKAPLFNKAYNFQRTVSGLSKRAIYKSSKNEEKITFKCYALATTFDAFYYDSTSQMTLAIKMSLLRDGSWYW